MLLLFDFSLNLWIINSHHRLKCHLKLFFQFFFSGKLKRGNIFFNQIYVSDSEKNEDYWAKRVKNNIAARRSREARRLKENQVRSKVFLNGPIPASFSVYFRLFNMSQLKFKFILMKAKTVCLGFKPGAAGWKVQTKPLSYA